jgi:hypothetical protein
MDSVLVFWWNLCNWLQQIELFCLRAKKWVESERFCRWCRKLRITGFLIFVHRPEFYILENNVSETGSVSVLRWVEGDTLLGPLERVNLNDWSTHKVNLRLTVSRPIYLGVGAPSGAQDQFFFSAWQLRVSWYGAPSLTRGWDCKLLSQLFLGLARAVTLQPKSRRTHGPYFTVSSETPPTWRARFPYLYPPGTGWPSYTPGHIPTTT